MSMSQELTAILGSSKVPKAFVEFLEHIRCHDVESFALIASSEDNVQTHLIDKSNVLAADDFMASVFIKKAWFAARNSWGQASGASSSGPSMPDNFLPPHVAEKLLKSWKSRYFYQLGGARMVTDILLVKLYKGLSKAQRILEFVPIENIRLKNSLTGSEFKGITFSDSAKLMPVTIDIEEWSAETALSSGLRLGLL